MVGVKLIKAADEGINGVDAFAMNPDGLPYIGSRGQMAAFRWGK